MEALLGRSLLRDAERANELCKIRAAARRVPTRGCAQAALFGRGAARLLNRHRVDWTPISPQRARAAPTRGALRSLTSAMRHVPAKQNAASARAQPRRYSSAAAPSALFHTPRSPAPPRCPVPHAAPPPAAMLSSANEALLREVAAKLTAEQWIFDFLFKADCLSDISLLTSPLRLRHALLTVRDTTAVEASANHAQVLDYHATSTTLNIPAFALDGVTVGLCAHERTVEKRWPFLQPARHALHFTRFARFDAANAMLAVRHAPAHADLEVELTTLRSPKRKSELRFSLDGAAPAFAGAAALDPDNLVALMRSNLTQLSKTEYCRICPVCAAAPAASCRCRTPGARARHVLDFAHNEPNITLYTGEYTGGAGVELFRTGVQALTASLECTDSMSIRVDPSAVSVLQQKAIRNRLSSYRLAPMRYVPKSDGAKKEPHMNAKSTGDDTASQLAHLLTAADFEYPDLSLVLGGPDAAKDASSKDSGAEAGMCRKEKNRMAAARSNLKRKYRNRSLRLNLVILRQRIAELRELENELRCEQMWLKQRCRLELPPEQIGDAASEA